MTFRAAAIVGGVLFALLLVEGTLRFLPQLFSREVLDWAFSRYDTLPGGMYVKEPRTGMRFMRADFSTRAYANGYWWSHRTDDLGFRNPSEVDSRGVLLLGDSLIYGHGVEEEDTVSSFLRTEHGVPAYNMASQGQCLYEHYVLLRLYLDRLRPETVVLFVYLNDFRDLEKKRSTEEITKIPELRNYDYEKIFHRVETLRTHHPPWLERAFFEPGIVRLASKWLDSRSRHRRFLLEDSEAAGPDGRRTNKNNRSPRAEKKSGPALRNPDKDGSKLTINRALKRLEKSPGRVEAAVLFPERFRPIALYYNRVLEELAERCNKGGVRLVVVQLFLAKEESRGPLQARCNRKLHGMLSKNADRHAFELYDTEALYTNAEVACFLPDDGHFTAEGHRRLAQFLAREVLQ